MVPLSTESHHEQGSGARPDLEERVHVDLPRIRPEDMVTTQEVVPARDPEAGRNTDMEFLTRNAGW